MSDSPNPPFLPHYAVLPDSFHSDLLEKRPSQVTALKIILSNLCINGLVADLHGGYWSRHILNDLLPTLSPKIRADLQDYLIRLKDRNRLVDCKAGRYRPSSGEDWIQVALEHAGMLQGIFLSATLLSRSGRSEPLLWELSEAVSPEWLERPRTISVVTSISEYERLLSPILRYATSLDIVDPYMTAQDRRFLDVVKLCTRLIGYRRLHATTRRIQIHAKDLSYGEDSAFNSNCLHAWKSALQPLSDAYNIRFKVFLWSDYGKPRLFHDRFFLTDQCGLQLGLGSDVRSVARPENDTVWSLLDDDVRLFQLSKFTIASAAYDRKESLEINPM